MGFLYKNSMFLFEFCFDFIKRQFKLTIGINANFTSVTSNDS